MNLNINLPDAESQVLEDRARERGMTAEQYALQVLEQNLAPEWLRASWALARENQLDQLSLREIDAEIAAARKANRERSSQPGS